MRTCAAAAELASVLGLSENERSTVYWTALLRSVGCTATSHEYATQLGGDDVRVRATADRADLTTPGEALGFVAGLTAGSSLPQRIGRGAAIASRAKRVAREGARADCEVAARMAIRFGLGEDVEASLRDVFERWDGKGFPAGRKKEDVAFAARVSAVANAAVAASADLGADGAADTVRRWSGRALDPGVADAFLREQESVLGPAASDDALEAALAAEPRPRHADAARLDEIALGFADAADLKAPFLQGHSRGVAELAEAAAGRLGLPEDGIAALRRAALLHDLGRVAVPTGIWEKPAPLAPLEWEAVRLHPYHGERILVRSQALAALGDVAGRHHERLDGSGYHRGCRAAELDLPARILAAADVYRALTEGRPHRAAFAPDEAARLLSAEALDPDAVAAVLEAAGHAAPRRRSYPAGLTEREVEVLRLLARGLSKKQIAGLLVVSPSTVHTHVVHVYEKAGVSTRAGAAVFALEHGLLRGDADPAKID
ncbi:MAG TPA: HD domain-containing phosphohydrolase [Gaiellaceae bacterium]|jgi:HD-GYP domain-containing protein (c-di-GMP phosphodiesterase class II)